MKTIYLLANILILGLLFGGCATILTDSDQKISLQSNRPYTVELNGAEHTTPKIISVEKENQDLILSVKECNKKIIVGRDIEGTFWVNILSGGVLGSATDYATGKMWKYDQNNIDINCN